MTEIAWPRQLGNTGFEVSALAVGGGLGLLDDPQAGPARQEAEAIAALRRAVELGLNYFDTSPSYGNGRAERHLGLGLREFSSEERSHLCISTKVGTHPERRQCYDADTIRWSLEQSLAVLFCEQVEIVFVHDPSTDEHMDQIMGPGGALEALEGLKAQGVIQAIGLGVRNHRFQRRAIESNRLDVVLTPYDYTLIRSSARPVIELAAARGLGVVNGSPYRSGLLAGLDPDATSQRRNHVPAELERMRALWQWCRARDLDLGALAMQYSLRHEHIHTTLVGPRTAREVEGNFCHATTGFPAAVWAELDRFLETLGPAPPGGEAL